MRERGEILGDGLEAVKTETVLTQSDLKLTLLLIEALVDIRDIMQTELKRIDTTETRFIKTP